jgi:hypothetical protein
MEEPSVNSIVAGFGNGGAFRDPGSIDPERGSGTLPDRSDSSVGRDPICTLVVSILACLKYGRPIKNKT